MVRYIPKRGDMVWLEFDPQKGKEIQKTRPALVISPYPYNQKTGLGLFMSITSQIKGYPFEIPIEIEEIKGAILCDQMRSLDWRARKAKFAVHVSSSIISDALAKLNVLLL